MTSALKALLYILDLSAIVCLVLVADKGTPLFYGACITCVITTITLLVMGAIIAASNSDTRRNIGRRYIK